MTDPTSHIHDLVEQRIALETKLQNEKGELSGEAFQGYDREYAQLQRRLAGLFKEAPADQHRVTLMLEMMRILENRLVYLHNFTVDPTDETRILAGLVTRFIDELSASGSPVLTTLEATYYRSVAALYAGDPVTARHGFGAACASEESDEANDIKYKSYVILGHLSHDDHDYEKAKELHEQSMRYSQNPNVTAQALALKALNAYALGDQEDARHLFEESLALFDPDLPFFNSYFYRNALLFCGAIHFDRKEYDRAEDLYRRVLASSDQSSYDHFDALSHIGRIQFTQGRYDEAVATLEKAAHVQRFSENEYIVDTWFWIARSHLKRGDFAAAKTYLERITSSEVRYEKKPQAVELYRSLSQG